MESISIIVILLWVAIFGICDTIISRFTVFYNKIIAYIIIGIIAILILKLNKNKYMLVL
tara:strand:- start:2931 stop:3107 length:177 start_codon:yes stop_codon:yes gene_type:complete